MKNRIFLLIGLFLSIAVNAQLNSSDSQEIIFPTSLERLSKIYGTSYQELKQPLGEGSYYQWELEQGAVVVFVPLSEREQYIGITAPLSEGYNITGLPYDLVFNKTLLEECKVLFASYQPDWQKDEEGGYTKLSFEDDDTFIYLYFYSDSGEGEVLKALTISTVPLD